MFMGVALAGLAGAAPVASAPAGLVQVQAVRPKPAAEPVEPARVIAAYPHDAGAFTQGLFFSDGRLFESTGQHGQSGLREVELKTGRVLREVKLARRYFGEGSTAWGKTIISLTWQHGVAFRWDRDSFRPLGQFSYTGEGWGLTHDASDLIMSDGSAELRFLDPATFAERRRIRVKWQGKPVRQLNELEYVRGEILANIWHSDLIARIDPASGVIKRFIDLSQVTASLKLRDSEAVLNGIAYDAKAGKLYVTGKDWPKLFEIALPQ
ncbi:glutamine cyclotransferase [Sphingomonas turrisvirgatae]|uniref:Glutamine cyclotransferase n=2 Tax=Sphingomonas turrisvirgatae TaxID=1888892 RepID=A0A1E3LU94_9SPHN|nr:glutamine cyclotransferase [Sphingomonas turrisvirgatae]